MADDLERAADRVASFGSPGYEDSDLTEILTEAESLYVKKFLNGKNNRLGESFDETEVRKQGLSALVKRGSILTTSSSQVGIVPNGKFFDLPSDFMYCIHEEAYIDQNVCNTETPISADVIPMEYDKISRFSKNKYKKPYFKSYGDSKVWRLVFSREVDGDVPGNPATEKRHQLVSDGTFEVNVYSINYLRNPKGVVVDRSVVTNQRNCILDESTHFVIIDIALSLLLNTVKEQEINNVESFNDLE